jgi:outer membrane protein W
MRLTVPRSVLRILLALPLFALPTLAAADGAFLFKAGQMNLTDSTQTLEGLPRDFDDESYGTLAMTWEARKPSGAAFGIEFLTYRNDFTPPLVEPGEARTWALQFVGKKYFLKEGVFHPFFGAGIGLARANYTYLSSGVEISDEEVNLALQAMIGFELRFEELVFSLEAKHLYHDIEGGGNEYDPTATGVFAGFGFTW